MVIINNWIIIDYGDELLFTHTKDICVRPKKIVDFINKDPSNKNIYRSYLLLRIFLENNALGNISIIFFLEYLGERIEDMLRKIFENIKQGLMPNKNSWIYHIITLIKAWRQYNHEDSLEMLLSYRIPWLLINFIGNNCKHMHPMSWYFTSS